MFVSYNQWDINKHTETITGVTFGGPGGRKALWAQRGIEKAVFSIEFVIKSKEIAFKT